MPTVQPTVVFHMMSSSYNYDVVELLLR
jgi:hypothetical protein